MMQTLIIGEEYEDIPGEKVLYDADPDELWAARGGIMFRKETPGFETWCSIVDSDELPSVSSDLVVFLSGARSKELSSLGMCTKAPLRGKKLGVILLDDPDQKEMKRVESIVRRHVPKTFNAGFFKKAWQALLTHTYLHELGHWNYIRKHGGRGSEAQHEQEAERFAWRWMERAFPTEIVAGTMGLNWVLDFVLSVED